MEILFRLGRGAIGRTMRRMRAMTERDIYSVRWEEEGIRARL